MPALYPKLNDFIQQANIIDSLPFPKRNTIDFYKTLKRALSINLKMFGHYSARKAALSSFDYVILAKDSNDQLKANEARTRLNSSILTVIDNQLKTIAFGSLLVKIIAVNKDNSNKIIVDKIFEPTEFDVDFPFAYIYKRPDGKEYEIINLIETNNYLFCSAEFPHRGGLLRSVMPTEIMRLDMILEYGNYLRKMKGLLQIVNKGGSDEDQAAAQSAAQNVVRDNFFISSDAIELKLNQISASSSTAFKDFIEEINSSIAIAWLGQANTPELPKYSGSRAALQVQRMISADIFYSDMIRTENLINNLLLIDFRLNYDRNASIIDLPYRFSFNLSEEQDFESNANAIRSIIDVVPLLENEVYYKLGFTPPKPEDKIFKGFSM